MQAEDSEDEAGFDDVTPAEDAPSDDELGEEDTAVRTQNKTLKSEISQHKAELEALKKKDPEFYKYLEDYDKELLDFDEEDEEMGGEEEDEAGGGEEEEEKEGGGVGKGREELVLTAAMVDGWCKAAKEVGFHMSYSSFKSSYLIIWLFR
jgi:nucleolar complex protein 2